jgi:hypothetical protein
MTAGRSRTISPTTGGATSYRKLTKKNVYGYHDVSALTIMVGGEIVATYI